MSECVCVFSVSECVCALSLSLKHDFSSASDDDVSLLWSNTARKIGIAGG